MNRLYMKSVNVLFVCITLFQSKGEAIRESLIDTLFGNLVTIDEEIDLPEEYFSVYNPHNRSATQFRFNLTNGTLHMRSTEQYNTSVGGCKVDQKDHTGFCHLPIVGSFAKYVSYLSYGSAIKQTFITNVTVVEYTSWNNPADLSAYLRHDGNKGFLLREVRVTEFMLNTVATPPFRNFTFDVFTKDPSMADYVWDNFSERMYRTVKLRMKDEMEKQYSFKIEDRIGSYDL